MKITDEKIEANRRNGKKSSGPKDTSSTRFNATKHGLLARGLTELDDAEGYREILRSLKQGNAQVVNNFIHDYVALLIVRMRRIPRLEAECVTGALYPPTYDEAQDPLTSLKGPLLDPGQPARIRDGHLEYLLRLQRYEAGLQTMFFRWMDVVRQEPPMKGGKLPAPTVVDATVHYERTDDSRSGCSHQQVLAGEFSESPREDVADPAGDASAVRTQGEQAVGESFSDVPSEKDSDVTGDVKVDADPASWDPQSGSAEDQLLEDAAPEPGNEEDLDAER